MEKETREAVERLGQNAMSQKVVRIDDENAEAGEMGYGQGGVVLEQYRARGAGGRSCSVYRTATGWHVGSVWE